MPLRVGLTYTQMKLGRGYQHLDELKAAVSAFRNDGYTVNRQDDLSNSLHHVEIEQKITPDSIGILAGEFAYCLRSGLDHLAWQLALLTTDAPNDATSFPIYGKQPGPKSRYWEAISNIPPKAAAIIDSLQPHHCGARFKDDCLWQLNRLCNIDKHQVVAVGCIEFQIRIDGVSSAWRKDLKHTIVISVPIAEKDNLQLNIDVPGVVFGEPIETTDAVSDFEITLDRLGEIYYLVRYDVVPKFAGFFQQEIASNLAESQRIEPPGKVDPQGKR